jgi:hypothetical protein
MLLPDFSIPFLEGTIWLVQGILYYEDKRGRQKKIGKVNLKEVKYGF